MFNILFYLLIVAAFVESITTAYGLLSGKAKEINPFLKWMIRKLGTRGMLTAKAFGTIAILAGVSESRSIVVVMILLIPITIVCVLNTRTLIKSKVHA